MFFLQRPTTTAIERFLDRSRTLPLSYQPTGIVRGPSFLSRLDDVIAVIGRGDADFVRARAALTAWRQFNVGWIETFPRDASIEPGTTLAVLIRHAGFWSLNGTRVLQPAAGDTTRDGNWCTFGYTYGTLTNHAEHGEELFEVSLDPQSGEVRYRIRAVSWPQSPLALLGHPIARALQACFRRDSAAVMRRLTAHGTRGRDAGAGR